ncbi:MAG: dienelactone hydrolase family protein [Ignavibacteriaceae bacterium]|nr:dienelactone hydrolase family protein [Ignavibacteriaceae bacterium]
MSGKIFSILFTILFLTTLNAQNSKEVSFMSNQDTVLGYLSLPKGEGEHPALILVHEWWGLTQWMKDNADMFAKKGYVALCVDLYRGKVTDKPEEASKLAQGLNQEQAGKDVISSFNYLKTLSQVDVNRIGCIGWCMGGGYSLQGAINIPELKATVVCYGRLTTDSMQVNKIQSPVLGIFGEEDKNIPPDAVKQFEQAMKTQGKHIKVYEYPNSAHAFMNQNNPTYNKATTKEAWKEIYAFLSDRLKK